MKRVIFFLITLTLFISSCQWNPGTWWPEEDAPEGEILRYDRLLDEFVSLNSFSALQRMHTEYPQATRLLIEDVLTLGKVQEPRIEQKLRNFYLDSTMQVLLEDVHREYTDLSGEEKELNRVFRQLKKIDPNFRIPRVYAQISGLNQSIVVVDSVLGISLDKYLGEDYPLYKKYYYDYQRCVMNRERLVPDALFFYLNSEYPLPGDKVHTLLDYMVDYGKITWVIAHCRNVDLIKQTAIDPESEEWYLQHEGQVWKWIREHRALDTSDMTVVRLFMEPRENTPCFGAEAPDKIGLWLGIQIVDHYMKSHPELTVGDLLHTNDYKRILKESGFHPAVK